MCLAWGKTPSEMAALPRDDRAEMWAFWKWRGERQNLLQERERMNQQSRGGG